MESWILQPLFWKIQGVERTPSPRAATIGLRVAFVDGRFWIAVTDLWLMEVQGLLRKRSAPVH